MENKKNFKVAADLLKLQYGYKKGSHSENLYFDFVATEGRIEVFNASSKYDEAFYWPEEVCKIAESCRLSCHASYKEINGDKKVVFVIH